MAYTTINKSTDYFNTKLYTGNGGTQSITGVGFQPDFTWIKGRSGTYGAVDHMLFDAVRGATKEIRSNTTSAEDANATTLTSFNSDGFSLSTKTNVNGSSTEYASWNWRAATGAGSANTDGSINADASVNTTSGFSIVAYTGTGSNATVGHGLGVAPSLIITKARTANGRFWGVYSKPLGNTGVMALNSSQAFDTSATYWNNTSPTDTVFSVGTNGDTNSASAMIAYCFADKQGYSKFGSYTGNGSTDGPFIYTGFKPAFIMTKNITAGSTDWTVCDSKRDGFNDNNKRLFPNQNSAESGANPWQMYSNGFKMTTTGSFVNTNGDNFIYMAFAAAPLVGTNNIPANAE